ncbi:MFS transporter [Streptomyces rubradiris]|uniref:MFS transporter n=1 Tax=Streptomyces rubradiris TaxID=285531 RepID=UPI001673B3D3|nr:MFS transporter [Streptomyces rubradiris]
MKLGAPPGQASLPAAAATMPAFALALPGGVGGDGYPKKRIMVGTGLAAAAVVFRGAGLLDHGVPSVPVLYAVALLLGALTVLHQAASVAIVPEIVARSQPFPGAPGERADRGRDLPGGHGRGSVAGGHMTSMSACAPAAVEVPQALGLAPDLRCLEPGSGPGVCLAVAAAITDPGLATGVERVGHMAAWARRNLGRRGVGAVVVGDAGFSVLLVRRPGCGT